MSYVSPHADRISSTLKDGYSPMPSTGGTISLNTWAADYSGAGFLSGNFPDAITKVEGVPGAAAVRVHYRPAPGERGDGDLVAEAQSAADGTWRIEGLNPALKFDVICRQPGYNDMILADVSPVAL